MKLSFRAKYSARNRRCQEEYSEIPRFYTAKAVALRRRNAISGGAKPEPCMPRDMHGSSRREQGQVLSTTPDYLNLKELKNAW